MFPFTKFTYSKSTKINGHETSTSKNPTIILLLTFFFSSTAIAFASFT